MKKLVAFTGLMILLWITLLAAASGWILFLVEGPGDAYVPEGSCMILKRGSDFDLFEGPYSKTLVAPERAWESTDCSMGEPEFFWNNDQPYTVDLAVGPIAVEVVVLDLNRAPASLQIDGVEVAVLEGWVAEYSTTLTDGQILTLETTDSIGIYVKFTPLEQPEYSVEVSADCDGAIIDWSADTAAALALTGIDINGNPIDVSIPVGPGQGVEVIDWQATGFGERIVSLSVTMSAEGEVVASDSFEALMTCGLPGYAVTVTADCDRAEVGWSSDTAAVLALTGIDINGNPIDVSIPVGPGQGVEVIDWQAVGLEERTAILNAFLSVDDQAVTVGMFEDTFDCVYKTFLPFGTNEPSNRIEECTFLFEAEGTIEEGSQQGAFYFEEISPRGQLVNRSLKVTNLREEILGDPDLLVPAEGPDDPPFLGAYFLSPTGFGDDWQGGLIRAVATVVVRIANVFTQDGGDWGPVYISAGTWSTTLQNLNDKNFQDLEADVTLQPGDEFVFDAYDSVAYNAYVCVPTQ
jgi:hypothetical protein